MTDITLFTSNQEQEILKAIDEIPFGNSGYQIEKLVLSQPSDSRNYRQALLEMWDKYKILKNAQFRRRRNLVEREQNVFLLGLEKDALKKELLQIDIEESDFNISIEDKLIKDAIIELNVYQHMFNRMKKMNRQEFEDAEEEHHKAKAIQQSERDILTQGSISQGNLEYLANINLNPYSVDLELKKVKENNQRLLSEKII